MLLIKVPTIYDKLLEFHKQNSQFKLDYNRTKISEIFSDKMRVMASSSAPLKTQTFNSWLNLTGSRLLERYGVTETGFCLSNMIPEAESKKRISGTSGRPYGEYLVRITSMDDAKKVLVESSASADEVSENQSIIGELEVKGPMVFQKYLNNPERTRKVFTEDGWLRTG